MQVVQHLADKAVGTVGGRQQGREQSIEDFALVVGLDEQGLRLADGLEHAVLTVKPVLRELGLGDIGDESVPENGTVGLPLGHGLALVPPDAPAGQLGTKGVAPRGQPSPRLPQGMKKAGQVVGVNPLEHLTDVRSHLVRFEFKDVTGGIAGKHNLAGSAWSAPGHVDQTRHPRGSVPDELQLMGDLGGRRLLGGDVHHHAEVGVGLPGHHGAADAGAKPAGAAVGQLPSEIHLAFVAGLPGRKPGSFILRMNATSPNRLAQDIDRLHVRDREKTR